MSTVRKLQGACLVLSLLLVAALGDLYRLYGKLGVYAELERVHHPDTPTATQRSEAKAECALDQERVLEVLRDAATGSRDCVTTAMYDECVKWLQTCEAWQDFGNALDKLEEDDPLQPQD